jgi:hypothetical protein
MELFVRALDRRFGGAFNPGEGDGIGTLRTRRGKVIVRVITTTVDGGSFLGVSLEVPGSCER